MHVISYRDNFHYPILGLHHTDKYCYAFCAAGTNLIPELAVPYNAMDLY